MSKPASYTVQLTKKANGVLQMRLMVPGHEAIVMKPSELRDVAQGVITLFNATAKADDMTEKAFVEARSNGPQLSVCLASLEARVRALEQKALYGSAWTNNSGIRGGFL
jgi:hypothetical protein